MESKENLLKRREGLLQLKSYIRMRMKDIREKYDLGYAPRSRKHKSDFYLGKSKSKAYEEYEIDVKRLAIVNKDLAEIRKKLNALKDINNKMEEWFIENELF